MLIVPIDGKTFSNMLQTSQAVDISNKIDVRGITKAKDGAVLLYTKDEQTGQWLTEHLHKTLENYEDIRNKALKMTLEILDMDCFTKKLKFGRH